MELVYEFISDCTKLVCKVVWIIISCKVVVNIAVGVTNIISWKNVATVTWYFLVCQSSVALTSPQEEF